MHHFVHREGRFFCEDMAVAEIAETVGTPFYLYSAATLKRHFRAYQDAFEGIPHLLCYSAKANTNRAVMALFASLGGGLDIVSGGELFRGLSAGVPANRIVYSGVGKTPGEMDRALSAGILLFNVERLPELHLLNERAGALGKIAPVAVRVNPDVDAKTHPYISTGMKKNKFGIPAEDALSVYETARDLPHVAPLGIDCHIGSQITRVGPFTEAAQSLKDLIAEISGLGISLKYVDLGGGLGIPYDAETPPPPSEYAGAVVNVLGDTGLTLILEPGRSMVGNAGIFVTRILHIKKGEEKNFVVVDGGMNDLMRPAMYDAFHKVVPVEMRDGPAITGDVVGPICESSDFFARGREIGAVAPGDLLAVMSAGAYGFSMSSNYNSRRRAAEVMVSGDRFQVVRERETLEDLARGESVFQGLEAE